MPRILANEKAGALTNHSALVKAAYDYALDNELVPVATCSYAVKWLERHPEYNGKTGKDYAGEGTCAL